MKVVEIQGKRQAALREVPQPRAQGEFVVVKIHVAPLCTEYKSFRDGHVSHNIGHEAAGEVVEVAQPGSVKVGDRVVVMPQYPCGKCALCLDGNYIRCQHNHDMSKLTDNNAGLGTMGQYLLKQDWLLLPIPEGMSYEHASEACCGLGPTFGACQIMHVGAFDTLLIAGLGPVGLGGVIHGAFRRARVIGLDPQPYRRKLAEELGADAVLDPLDADALARIKDLTGGLGADKAVDTSGVAATQRLLFDGLRPEGHMAFIAPAGAPNITAEEFFIKGLHAHGVWHFTLGDAPRLMQMIRQVGPQLDKHITHTFPMSRVQQAFELQLTGDCGKVLLYPWK